MKKLQLGWMMVGVNCLPLSFLNKADMGDCELGKEFCTGPMNLFYTESVDIYSEIDGDFKQFIKPPGANVIKIGVVDTGIYASEDPYLGPHVVGGWNFADAFALNGGVRTPIPKDGSFLGEAIVDKKPDTLEPHGTRVAGQVAWGTPQIELLDVFVQKVNSGGKDMEPYIVHAINWAIAQGATVITASITITWNHDILQEMVEANPNVLFLGTTGNARRDFDLTFVGKTHDNLILVGGCQKDGGFHANRGFGAHTVDVFVPSDDIPLYEPADARHDLTAKKKAIQLEEIEDAEKKAAEETEVKAARIKAEREKSGLPPPKKITPARWQDFAKGMALLPTVTVQDAVIGLGNDDGVSFGIPVVANVAAKISLICPKYNAKEIADILRSTANVDVKKELAGKGKAQMINPLAAYTKAAAECGK